MLNFDQIITQAAQSAGNRPVLAAPYPLSENLCRRLASDGIIGGFIANQRPESGQVESAIAGWWIDRSRGAWFIRGSTADTMIMLGATPGSNVSARLLLEARLKGIRRMLLVAEDGSIASEVDVGSTLITRMEAVAIADPIHQISYEDMFRDIYAFVGDRLKLPYAAFDPECVLIMTGNLDPGGAERQIAYTAVGLAQRFPGHIHVGRTYSDPSRNFFKPEIEAGGVRLWATPESSREYDAPHFVEVRNKLAARYRPLGVLSIFELIFHHALLIQEVRPGLVHTWLDFSNVLAGVAADLVGVPRLVLSGRSVAPDNFSIFQPYMAPAYHALFRNRDAMFLNNSHAGADDYARWLGFSRSRFRVVHNGFRFPEVPSDARAKTRSAFGIPDDAVVVGSIIRFSDEKRPELMLDVARNLHRTHPQVCFLVFGEGPLLESCRAAVAAENLSHVVKLPGLTREAFAALAAMDVFILTSRMEGLPNVLIESQASGCPVVCTGAGGMKETFIEGQTGFAVESAHGGDIAEVVRRLVDDPALRHRMGKQAQRHARDTFGLERMINETIVAYHDAPEERSDFKRSPDWLDAAVSSGIRLGGIVRDQGHGFVASFTERRDLSGLELWEDDNPLGAGNDSRELVGEFGAGRYRIDDGSVIFSSTDRTDPRFNGRTYRLRPAGAEREFEEIAVSTALMNSEIGLCYVAELGLGQGSAHFALWEDETLLGPGGTLHDDIRALGKGRYSVWGSSLYFSSSDGSDPRINQHRYVLRRRRTAAVPVYSHGEFSKYSLDQALRHLTRHGVPHRDFVRGRIVHIGGSLGPGGAERQILYTLEGLVKAPIESAQLMCYYLGAAKSDRHRFYLPAFVAAGVPVRAIRRHTGQNELANMPEPLRDVAELLPARLAADIADLYWEFRELRPEVVHAWLDWTNERAAFAAALAGVPRIIVSGRNMNPTYFPFYEPYMDVAYRALLDLPQVTMINNSEAGRDDYAKWLGVDAHQIPVIYNGVEFGAATRSSQTEIARLRHKFSLRENAFVVGGVFRFAAEKRPLLWIEAAAEILHRIPHAEFILLGGGEMLAEMKDAVERFGLADRLIFGGVTEDILEAMSMMDVFLLTSMVEGVPNVVLEAQWVGTPVVATRAGGTPEALEQDQTGWIVEPAEPVAIAERIKWLHDNPQVSAACRTAGPELVRKKFGVTRMIDETLGVYGMARTKSGAP